MKKMTEEEREGFEMELIFTHGYSHLREKPGRGMCALHYFIHTIGLCYGVDETGYEGRYCFSEIGEAMRSIDAWTGEGDPPGNWIKHKGKIEYPNPNNVSDENYM